MFEALGKRRLSESLMQDKLKKKKEQVSVVEMEAKMVEDRAVVLRHDLELTKDKSAHLELKHSLHSAKVKEVNNSLDSRDAILKQLKKQVTAKGAIEARGASMCEAETLRWRPLCCPWRALSGAKADQPGRLVCVPRPQSALPWHVVSRPR